MGRDKGGQECSGGTVVGKKKCMCAYEPAACIGTAYQVSGVNVPDLHCWFQGLEQVPRLSEKALHRLGNM